VNRNSFATFAAFGMALGFALALDMIAGSRGEGRRGAFADVTYRLGVTATGLAIIASALVLSASRMGAFAAATGVLAVVAMALARGGSRRATLVGVLVMVPIAALVMALSGAGLLGRLGSLETNA